MTNSATEMQTSLIQTSDEEAYAFAGHFTTASVSSMFLKVAIELGLLDIISKVSPEGFMSAMEVASHLATANPDAPIMIDRILRVLASSSIVNCTLRTLPNSKVERIYALPSISKYLTQNECGKSLTVLHLLNHNKMLLNSWSYLKDAILEGGIPWNRGYGETVFDSIAKDPSFARDFNRAMDGNTKIVMGKLLESYDGFNGVKSLVDVGGGLGISVHLIISRYPNIKGVNFDLPHVIEKAPTYPGVEHVGGDMFASIPKADTIFLKGVLHDWDDDHCVKLLKKCYEAVPEDGKVILVDWVVPQVPDSSLDSKFILGLDGLMMAFSHGGKERTQQEFSELGKKAGFHGSRQLCSVFCYGVMELIKTVI